MQTKHFHALAAIALCTLSLSAQAEIQTWRLTGVVDRVSAADGVDFTAPAWLGDQQTVVVDYDIDMAAPMVMADFYSSAVKSVTFNNQTFHAGGYIFSWEDSLFGLNATLLPSDTGGIDFLSFGVWNAPSSGPDLATVLGKVSNMTSAPENFLRFDFGDSASVYLRTQSFAAVVPEPATLAMALIGLTAIAGLGIGRQARRA